MKRLRDLAQRQFDELRGVVTASVAIDPSELVTAKYVEEFNTVALAIWSELGVLSRRLGLTAYPWSDYDDLIENVVYYAGLSWNDAIKKLLTVLSNNVPVLGEFIAAPDYVPGTGLRPPLFPVVQYGDVRPTLGALGGGSVDSAVPLSSGITNGELYARILADNNISTDDKLWIYGDEIRRPFNGHMQVDGLVFNSWNDRALEIAPQDYWLRIERYFPGDHWGCACMVVPYIPNFGEPYTVTFTASADVESVEFACRDSSCRPPNSGGTGGSLPSGIDDFIQGVKTHGYGVVPDHPSEKWMGTALVALSELPIARSTLESNAERVSVAAGKVRHLSAKQYRLQVRQIGEMFLAKSTTASAEIEAIEFACNDKACAPPPVGTGGSLPSGGRESARIGGITVGSTPLTEDILANSPQHFIELAYPRSFSGYKAHVYAEDIDGIHSILTRIEDELASESNPNGWGAKVATQRFLDFVKEPHAQHGKAVTIYFPHKATWEKDRKYLVELMAGLPPRQHKGVEGDSYVGNGVSTRYELRDGAPDRDLDFSEYREWYKAAEFDIEIDTIEFACRDESCAPPPVGTGGSLPGTSSGGGITLKSKDWTEEEKFLDRGGLPAITSGDHVFLLTGVTPTDIRHGFESFSGPNGETVELTMIQSQMKGGRVVVEGKILLPSTDPDPEIRKLLPLRTIGKFERQYYKVGSELRVNHDIFWLDDGAQGKGVGGAFLRHTVAHYKAQGVKKITVQATTNRSRSKMTNGAYTWAKLGFTLTPGESSRMFLQDAESVVGHKVSSLSEIMKSEQGVRWLKRGWPDGRPVVWGGEIEL